MISNQEQLGEERVMYPQRQEQIQLFQLKILNLR